ncbi:MAG: 50S ribosomal protein L21 [Candidatus Hinthialibacteria bacterium]|nr:MAG: 50S ribosomal protein L21 [Candidatus Hinthialibacteria bacterium OLB16]MCK6495728.1 50S ribosomal protein L21 [bacterium]NUP93855.1 50S ribosomal protein L21 [Candidatus Omnitrophota bacterium]
MVYAIIRSGGKQQRVQVGDRFDVELIHGEIGNRLEIDQVLAVGEGAELQIGAPFVGGAKVVCEIILQDRHRKIMVGKYHKRKRYYRRRGHRQSFTRLRVDAIQAEGIQAAAPPKQETTSEEAA